MEFFLQVGNNKEKRINSKKYNYIHSKFQTVGFILHLILAASGIYEKTPKWFRQQRQAAVFTHCKNANDTVVQFLRHQLLFNFHEKICISNHVIFSEVWNDRVIVIFSKANKLLGLVEGMQFQPLKNLQVLVYSKTEKNHVITC